MTFMEYLDSVSHLRFLMCSNLHLCAFDWSSCSGDTESLQHRGIAWLHENHRLSESGRNFLPLIVNDEVVTSNNSGGWVDVFFTMRPNRTNSWHTRPSDGVTLSLAHTICSVCLLALSWIPSLTVAWSIVRRFSDSICSIIHLKGSILNVRHKILELLKEARFIGVGGLFSYPSYKSMSPMKCSPTRKTPKTDKDFIVKNPSPSTKAESTNTS